MLEIKNIIFPSPEQKLWCIRGLRVPMTSVECSDSYIDECTGKFVLGQKDKELLVKLTRNGPSHRKLIQGLNILFEVSATNTWWNEMDTYRIGTVKASSSTRKIVLINNGFSLKDFETDTLMMTPETSLHMQDTVDILNTMLEKMKHETDGAEKNKIWECICDLIPKGYKYKRFQAISYETYINIKNLRTGHPHKDWDIFLKEIDSKCDEFDKVIFETACDTWVKNGGVK